MKIHNRKYLKDKRQALRNDLTSAEATLWTCLQKKKLAGRKFRRQHSVGNYILDFYCPQERLAVELDGQDHFTTSGWERDKKRDQFLEELNIKVLRFENFEVFHSLDNVLESIKSEFTTPSLHLPKSCTADRPPKLGGE